MKLQNFFTTKLNSINKKKLVAWGTSFLCLCVSLTLVAIVVINNHSNAAVKEENTTTAYETVINDVVYPTTSEETSNSNLSEDTFTDNSEEQTTLPAEEISANKENEQDGNISSHVTKKPSVQSNNTPTSAPVPVNEVTTTEKHIAYGTSRDINVTALQNEANAYLATLDGVTVDSSLTPENSSWSSRVYSFDNRNIASELKEFSRLEYNSCVANGCLDYDTGLRMYIMPEAIYKENVGEYYYCFYILYVN